MNKDDKQNLDNYLNEARSWETDKVLTLKKSESRAWLIAIISAVIALLSVLAVALLTPIKKVEPYLIRVDNSTGIVDVVHSLKNGETTYDEAINKYFTQKYVRYREGYSKALAEEYYENVSLLSSTTEQQRFYEFFKPQNPQSPLNVYGDYTKVNVEIKSTSFINDNVALVRYLKIIHHAGDKQPHISHWAATVTFQYTGSPMKEKEREINPLGYQVTDYRDDPDSSPETTYQHSTSPITPVTKPTQPNTSGFQ